MGRIFYNSVSSVKAETKAPGASPILNLVTQVTWRREVLYKSVMETRRNNR